MLLATAVTASMSIPLQCSTPTLMQGGDSMIDQDQWDSWVEEICQLTATDGPDGEAPGVTRILCLTHSLKETSSHHKPLPPVRVEYGHHTSALVALHTQSSQGHQRLMWLNRSGGGAPRGPKRCCVVPSRLSVSSCPSLVSLAVTRRHSGCPAAANTDDASPSIHCCMGNDRATRGLPMKPESHHGASGCLWPYVTPLPAYGAIWKSMGFGSQCLPH